MGNNRNNKEEIMSILNTWQRSGLSVFDFCKQERIHRSKFYYWKKRYIESPVVTEASGFVKMELGRAPSELFCEVVGSGGTRLLFYNDVEASYLRTFL